MASEQSNPAHTSSVSRPSSQRIIREAQPWLQYFPFADALEPRFLPSSTA